ncbi:hypothetical protein POV27_13160 [Aureisphaera galaxeae]|uniref:hypothetical protein n=1 Tax=Aureisphaera galaxeae TaxID=1538023 RepID=UPI0023500EF8|nr:hypothetical protein [Aureisphaera galaxeae]MDC8005005.1 hypothetical protein [Aureisphaera galaxeae]
MKIRFSLLFLCLTLGTVSSSLRAEEIDYDFRFDMACEYYINGLEIPEDILLDVVPYSDEEFSTFYYRSAEELEEFGYEFFYDVSGKIFEKAFVPEKKAFYTASLRLASFADGEFGEYYIEELEDIIAKDTGRFCAMAKGQSYSKFNPIKYFLEANNCDNRFN